MRLRFAFIMLTAVCLVAAPVARAQVQPDAPHPPDAQREQTTPAPPSSESNEYVIGAEPDYPRSEYYESPLKKLGLNLFLTPYVLGAFAGLIYLVSVYPVQALVGSSHVEGVMPWLLVPVLGPWMAQYTRHVKDEPFWRGVLIADAAIQATGLLLWGLGELLSGRRDLPPPTKAGLDVRIGGAGISLTFRTM